MSEAELRKVLNQDPQLSDIILQAFIARRQLMRESPEFTGLRVIGSRYSRDTFRIRDFLAKNRVLFTWLDLEGDPAVKAIAPAIRSDAKPTRPSLPARIVWSCAIRRIASWLKRSVFVVRSSTPFMIWPLLVQDRRDWRRRFMAHRKD